MGKQICTVCGREIDSRGMSGHMKSHKGKIKLDGDDGVISYPGNEDPYQDDEPQNPDVEYTPETKPPVKKQVKKQVKTQVKKRAASKPASSPASKPDAGGEDKPNSSSKSTGHPKDSGVTETEHKQEWRGLFRD